jgi:N-acetyl-anhydromuramyl-L-alanine amidase AmpD
MEFIEAPSPNFGPRPKGPPHMLVLHYTGMPTGEAALARLCDPAAEVSAHYMVEEDGRIFRLVAEERRAWHAGKSSWRGETDVNSASIGIEIVNPGHEFGYRPFPEPQVGAMTEGQDGAAVFALQAGFTRLGYDLPPDGKFDGHTAAVVRAFQRHWRQERVDGIADGETRARLIALLRLID